MDIAYVAYTESHTLLLDANGVCRTVSNGRASHGQSYAEQRCIGAQYVASIDPSEPGGLAKLPRVGVPMIFAAVGPDGHIYLVRTAPLVSFETCARSRRPRVSGWYEESLDGELQRMAGEDEPERETQRYNRRSAFDGGDTERMIMPPPGCVPTLEPQSPPSVPSRGGITLPYGTPLPPPPPLPLRRISTPLPAPPQGMPTPAAPPPSEVPTIPRMRTPASSSHASRRDSPAAVAARRWRR